MLSSPAYRAMSHAPAGGLIDHIDHGAWRAVNQSPFEFRHNLADNPLFSIERFALLSDRLSERPEYARYSNAADRRIPRDRLKRRLSNVILHIGRNGKWFSLHCIDEMELAYRARVYQVNYCMQKVGLNPRSPGVSPFRDAAKEALTRALSVSQARTP